MVVSFYHKPAVGCNVLLCHPFAVSGGVVGNYIIPASFETIAFLADKVKELDCKTIFTLENSSKDIANTIISTSGKDVQVAELNSLQSVSNDDIAGGASYISLMQGNYDVLADILK